MKYLYIVVLLLVWSTLYLFYKTRNLKSLSEEYSNIENFEEEISKAVDIKYKHDIDAIRNFAGITGNILQEDSFNIPTTKLYMNDIYLNGDLEIEENLIVDGNIDFINKNFINIDIFPRYMIINWPNDNIPKGWALCNGLKYSINTIGETILDSKYGIQTPDLRGRFVLGSGFGIGLTERKVGNKDGYESVSLRLHEIPSHKHEYAGFINGALYSGSWTILYRYSLDYLKTWQMDTKMDTKIEGSNAAPHENMPPFYVLNYIMKL